MKTEIPKPFDPTTGPTLKIVPCQNGWSLIQSSNQYDDLNTCCIVYPSHVFNSPAELANAVANLVQFGGIEKLPEKTRVLQPGFRPIAELPEYSQWWEFDTQCGVREMFVASGKVSDEATHHRFGESLSLWIERAGVIGFKSRGK